MAKSVMSRAEAFRAAHWVQTNWKDMVEWTRQQTAEKLSEYLGKPVSPAALSGLFTDIGKEFPGKMIRNNKTMRATGYKNREQISFLAGQLLRLDAAITDVFVALGEKRDQLTDLDRERLSDIINRRDSTPNQDNGQVSK